jgi:3-oxoacyl-[acyl-carrier-protein] synthase II
MTPGTEVAVGAASLAVQDSKLVTPAANADQPDIPSGRLACNIGAGLICQDLDELGTAVNVAKTDGRFDMKAWGARGLVALPPLWLLKYLPNMLSCHVTILQGARGPSNTITCGDASGHLAIGEAWRHIRRDLADGALAGGAESKLNLMGLLRQSMLRRLCTRGNDAPATACRPFDEAHAGTVIGEGGGVVILEDLELAVRRGARIYAEVIGVGAACDPAGIDVTRPTAGNLDLAAKKALADARIGPSDVGLIVAHGTGCPGEDVREAAAWQEALGDAARRTPAVAMTGAMGSLFAGAGGVELAVASMALKTGIVPPTMNFASPAKGCELNLSPQARRADIKHVVTGAFAVGGQSAACVLRHYEG